MLEVQELSAWYARAQALSDVSLSVAAGQMVVLQGLNGAGKSTLLQCCMGMGQEHGLHWRGQIRWHGSRIDSWPPYRRALQGIGYVAEDRRLFSDLSVEDNLMLAARGDVATQRARVLALFPALRPMLHRAALHMSGGEQQMLALARTLMSGPRLLLLDEPCEGIAPVLVEAMRDALLQLRAAGLGLLVAEQNEVLAQHADRVITLVAGVSAVRVAP